MPVPPPDAAVEDCKQMAAWYRTRNPGGLRWGNESTAGGLALLNWPQYCDELLEDMGLRSMRNVPKGILGWFTWVFVPIKNDELAGLAREREEKRVLQT